MKKVSCLVIVSLFCLSSILPVVNSIYVEKSTGVLENFLDMNLQLPTSNGWMKTFGGTLEDYGSFVQQTKDGGYVVIGYTESYGAGGTDIWLIKTDSDGNKLWDKTFGKSRFEYGHCIQQTTDGGYIIIGEKPHINNAYFLDIWLIKTDSDGNKEWDKTYSGSYIEIGTFVQQTTDGGYIFTGFTCSFGAGFYDIWLVKTDDRGNRVWNKTFGGLYFDTGRSVEQTMDGGYIVVGCKDPSSDYMVSDIWLIKTDSNGNEMWNRTFGGINGDSGFSVQQTTDYGYIIAGGTYSFSAGKSDVWLIKTDNHGNMVWNKTFGGDKDDIGYFVQQTTDRGYIITGCTRSFGSGLYDVWLIKTDSNGIEEWNRTFGGISNDEGLSVKQTSDGGYIITGQTYSFGAGDADVWLIKTNSEGLVNEPPKKPIILGQINGKPNTEYLYKFVSTDPDEDAIEYCIDWGDNSSEVCIGPYPSGTQASAKYTWSEKGSYTIKTKARDVYGAESDWSTLTVTMLKNKMNYMRDCILERLLGYLSFITNGSV